MGIQNKIDRALLSITAIAAAVIVIVLFVVYVVGGL